MDALNTAFEFYLNNTTMVNSILSILSPYLGISGSLHDSVKWIQKHATRRVILILCHVVLCALLYDMNHPSQSPLDEVIDKEQYTRNMVPVGMNLLPSQILSFLESNFVFRMIVRISFVAVELYTFIIGLPYYIATTYIPLYVGMCIAWILRLFPMISPKKNKWPLYGSLVAGCHLVIALYLYMYRHEIDKQYYVYTLRESVALLCGALYWLQLARIGNEIDKNDDGNFTIKEVIEWYKDTFFRKSSSDKKKHT